MTNQASTLQMSTAPWSPVGKTCLTVKGPVEERLISLQVPFGYVKLRSQVDLSSVGLVLNLTSSNI